MARRIRANGKAFVAKFPTDGVTPERDIGKEIRRKGAVNPKIDLSGLGPGRHGQISVLDPLPLRNFRTGEVFGVFLLEEGVATALPLMPEYGGFMAESDDGGRLRILSWRIALMEKFGAIVGDIEYHDALERLSRTDGLRPLLIGKSGGYAITERLTRGELRRLVGPSRPTPGRRRFPWRVLVAVAAAAAVVACLYLVEGAGHVLFAVAFGCGLWLRGRRKTAAAS